MNSRRSWIGELNSRIQTLQDEKKKMLADLEENGRLIEEAEEAKKDLQEQISSLEDRLETADREIEAGRQVGRDAADMIDRLAGTRKQMDQIMAELVRIRQNL